MDKEKDKIKSLLTGNDTTNVEHLYVILQTLHERIKYLEDKILLNKDVQ